MTAVLTALVVVLVLLGALVAASVRVLREYERAVVFRLGRLVNQRGPGLVLLIPGIDRMVRVSLRTVTLNIKPQDIITRDNVTARVDAVAYFRVVDPDASVTAVEDAVKATSQIAQTTLRSVLGKADLDTLLSERERLNEDLQKIIDEQTEPWGIKVGIVEVKDAELPQSMQRAMARQAEAEREKRAKIIHASGEFEASKMLTAAAKVIGSEPATIQLRYLQTLTEIASERNSTIIFPVPIELLSMIPHVLGKSTGTNGDIPALEADVEKALAAATGGDVALPVAGSEAENESSKPRASLLHQLNDAEIERARKEHNQFMTGSIPSSADTMPTPAPPEDTDPEQK
jgi:regulator of protease activity HflC (stomatin/prohibitin superfamily)